MDQIQIIPEMITFANVKPKCSSETSLILKNLSNKALQISFSLDSENHYQIQPSQSVLQGNCQQLYTLKIVCESLINIKIKDEIFVIVNEDYMQQIKINIIPQENSNLFDQFEQDIDNSGTKQTIYLQSNNLISASFRQQSNSKQKSINQQAYFEQIINQKDLKIEEQQEYIQQLIEQVQDLNDIIKQNENWIQNVKELSENEEFQEIYQKIIEKFKFESEIKNKNIIQCFNQKDKRISELEQQINDLQTQNTKIQNESSLMCNNLQSEYQKMIEENTIHKEQNFIMQQQINQQMSQYEELSQLFKKLQIDYSQQQQEHQDLVAELDYNKQNQSQYLNQHQILQQEQDNVIKTLKNELKDICNETLKNKQLIKMYQEETAKLKEELGQVQELKNELEIKKQQYKIAQNNLNSIEQQNSNLFNNLTKQQQKEKDLIDQNLQLSKQLNKEKQKVNKQEQKVEEYLSQIKIAEQLKEKYVHEIDVLQIHLQQNVKTEKADLIQKLNEKITQLKINENKLLQENSNLELMYNDLIKHNVSQENLQQRSYKSISQNSNLKPEIEKIDQLVFNQTIKQLEKQASQLHESEQKKQLQQQQTLITKYQMENEQYRQDIKTQQQELDQLRTEQIKNEGLIKHFEHQLEICNEKFRYQETIREQNDKEEQIVKQQRQFEVDNLKCKLEHLQQQLQDFDLVKQRLQNKENKYKSQIKQYKDLQSQNDNLIIENNHLNQQLKDSFVQYENELTNFKLQFQELKSKEETIRSEKQHLLKDNEYLRNQYEQDMKERQINNNILQQKESILQEQLQQLTQDIEQIQNKQKKKKASLGKSIDISNQNTEKLLNLQIQQQNQQIQRQQNIIQELNDKINFTDKNLMDKSSASFDERMLFELQTLRHQMEQIRKKKKNIQNQLNIKEHEIQESETYRNEIEEFLNKFQEQYYKLQQNSENQIDELNKKIQLMCGDMEKLEQDKTQLLLQLEENKMNNQQLINEIQQYAKTQQSLRTQVQEKENQMLQQRDQQHSKLVLYEQDKYKAEIAVQVIKDQLMQQNRDIQDTIQHYERHLDIFKKISTLSKDEQTKLLNNMTQEQKLRSKIQQLKQELGKKKQKQANDPKNETKNKPKAVKQEVQPSDVAQLEAQFMSAQTQIKMLNEEIRFLKDQNFYNQELYCKQQQQTDNSYAQQYEQLLKDYNKLKQKYNNELKQVKKLEMTMQQNQELQGIQQSNKIEKSLKEQEQMNQDYRQQIQLLKDDIDRKTKLIVSLKQQKTQLLDQLQDQEALNNINKEELEKLKKQQKQHNQQLQQTKNIKEQHSELSKKQIQQEIEQQKQQDKLKIQKAEIERLNKTIKDLRETNQKLTEEVQEIKTNQENNTNNEIRSKSNKKDQEYKDEVIKSLKKKLETNQIEVQELQEKLNSTQFQRNSKAENEIRQHDQTKIILKKLANQYNSVVFLIKRLFRENYVELTKIYNNQSQNIQYQKFQDSMQILNINPNELKQFLGNQSVDKQKFIMERFEAEFENEVLNINQLYLFIQDIINQRLQAK